MSSLQVSRRETAAQVAKVEASSLFEQHRHRVYRFCLGRLGDREEAHDAVQDTYAKAWLALRDGCEVREPLPWLLTIARNVCASRHRARSARPIETSLSDDAVATVTYLTRPELAGLPEAVRALPEEQRRAFVLRELRGCSYEEIGETMGASEASVAALLHRARRSVAATLTGTGRKMLVVVPFPAIVRSAFEGGGAVMAATAAATATGTGLLVGPHVPLPQRHPPPRPPAQVQQAPIVRAPLAIHAVVVARTEKNATPTMAGSKERSGPSTGISPVPRLSGSGGPRVVISVPPQSTTGSKVAPAGGSPWSAGDATDETAPSTATHSESNVGPDASGLAAPIATAPAPSGNDAQIVIAAGNDSEPSADTASAKALGDGPPAAPGSQRTDNGNSQWQGNGQPAGPDAEGHGKGGLGQGGPQSQGNGPPPDPGAQGNGGNSGNAGNSGNGKAGGPADPGSQGGPGRESQEGGKATAPLASG